MADMDFGTLKVYPGNYDDYMLASTQAKERQAVVEQPRLRNVSLSYRISCGVFQPINRRRARPRQPHEA